MAWNGIKRPNFCVKVIIERGSESRATQGTANALRAAAQRKQARQHRRRRRTKAAQEPKGYSANRATSPSKRKPQDCTPKEASRAANERQEKHSRKQEQQRSEPARDGEQAQRQQRANYVR